MTDQHEKRGLTVLTFDEDKRNEDYEEYFEEEEELEPTLEEMIEQIDEISSEMENGRLSLEDSFKKYKQGMDLIKKCTKQISAVEKQIQVLDEQGEIDDF